MKIILTAILIFATSFAQAEDNRYQDQAEDLFMSMSPVEALMSGEFTTREWNKLIPGTSTWYNPLNLCISGGNIQTKTPVKFCTQWAVNLKEAEFGQDVLYFDYKGQADEEAESSNARGRAYCSSEVYTVASGPMNYSVYSCVQWRKRGSDGDVNYYTSRATANRVGAQCSQWGQVPKTISSTFKVDFYRKTSSNKFDDDKYIDSYTYQLPRCGSTSLPPVPAN